MKLGSACLVCGRKDNVVRYYDPYDIEHDDEESRSYTPLCQAHDIFSSNEYRNGLVKTLRIRDVDDASRYINNLRDKLIEKEKRKNERQITSAGP